MSKKKASRIVAEKNTEPHASRRALRALLSTGPGGLITSVPKSSVSDTEGHHRLREIACREVDTRGVERKSERKPRAWRRLQSGERPRARAITRCCYRRLASFISVAPSSPVRYPSCRPRPKFWRVWHRARFSKTMIYDRRLILSRFLSFSATFSLYKSSILYR